MFLEFGKSKIEVLADSLSDKVCFLIHSWGLTASTWRGKGAKELLCVYLQEH
jgi:hypothetical protein